MLVVATVLSFAPALDNAFLSWDDDNNFMRNTHIRSFSWENVKWMWTTNLLGVWQPLTWMITALEYRTFDGANLAAFSRGMHVTSVALHAVAAVLVFLVARRLIALGLPQRAARSPIGLTVGATLTALLFAVHPFRVETVAWASGQAYILAIIPALAAVWCYLMAQQIGRRRWHGLALLCLGASLLCKAMSVPLVAVLLVLDVYPLRRVGGAAGWQPRRVLSILLEKLPYVVLTTACAYLTVQATWQTKSYRPDPLSIKLLITSFCTLFYVFETFVPYRLAPYYMKPVPFDPQNPWFVGAAILFVAITVLSVRFRRRAPHLLAVWVSYVVILLPNTGLVKHGGQMAADRYSYLSCIGWSVLIGAGLLRVWSGGRAVARAGTAVIGLAAAVGLATMTRAYCLDWKDSVSVWTAMVERNPRFHMGYYNRAKAHKQPCKALLKRAEAAEAEIAVEFRREARERFQRAEADYRQAISLYPLYPAANVDLGNMIRNGQASGDPAMAAEHYRTALKGRPGFHMAHLNLAYMLMTNRRYTEAIGHLTQAEADAERTDRSKLPGIRRALALARERAQPP